MKLLMIPLISGLLIGCFSSKHSDNLVSPVSQQANTVSSSSIYSSKTDNRPSSSIYSSEALVVNQSSSHNSSLVESSQVQLSSDTPFSSINHNLSSSSYSKPASSVHSIAAFYDPGTGPWDVVASENLIDECGLDPDLLKTANKYIRRSYAIIRFGKLCHEHHPKDQPQVNEKNLVYSVSKTLAAISFGKAVYETKHFTNTGPKTGPLSELDRVDHWLDRGSISYNKKAHIAHVLGMVAFNTDLGYGNKTFKYDANGKREINTLADIVVTAISQDSERLGNTFYDFVKKHISKPLGMGKLTWDNLPGEEVPPMATGWHTTIRDMARLGLLMIRNGIWSGDTIVDASWIYKMTHPAFESASTNYGYLTWVHPGECQPRPIHATYPHGLSLSTDCELSQCTQTYDVGVWSAIGAHGNYIFGHKGLDLVIVAKQLDPIPRELLWEVIRPALIKHDPVYQGDETEFCKDYSRGDYAPHLTY
ncbi:MAG: hypothetical protein OCD01_04230 [Fibrobacterales bacterium]